MRTRTVGFGIVAIVVAVAVARCGGGGGETPSAPPPPPGAGGAGDPAPGGGGKKGYTPGPVADGGTCAGKATWGGADVPTPAHQDAAKAHQDAATCEHPDQVDQSLFVDKASKGVANVVVYLKGITAGKAFAGGAKLDNQACLFHPHILIHPSGTTPLVISNSDPVGHNTHVNPKKNVPFNKQLTQGKTLEYGGPDEKLKVEGPIEIVCDLHPWMKAWGFIVEHPYYAVTDRTGAWTLTEVPAGTYDLVAWHEKSAAPSAAKSVTVAKGGTVTADLTVNPDGSLAWK